MDKIAVEELVNSLVNPLTKKTLGEESRIVSIKEEGSGILIEYNRDGITVSDKKTLENVIISALSDKFDEDDIMLMSLSRVNDDKHKHVHNSCGEKQDASLKVGHGSVGKKKRIPSVKSIIAVSSAKGGVGKSTVSVNLAISLKNLGKKVGIIDADIYGPSLPLLLDKRTAKPIANENKKILPIEAYGIHFMSFGLFVPETEAVIWRGPMLGGVLNQFFFDVDWGELDYLIIDLPPGTGDVQLSMVQALEIDSAIIVSTPQDVALLDSRRGLKMFQKVDVPICGLIENMSYFSPDESHGKKYYLFGEGGVKKASEELDVPFLGEIPMEIELRESCDKGFPYMANGAYEGRSVWSSYMNLAKNLEEKFEKKKSKSGFLGRLFGK